jgi:hypothetical protein
MSSTRPVPGDRQLPEATSWSSTARRLNAPISVRIYLKIQRPGGQPDRA